MKRFRNYFCGFVFAALAGFGCGDDGPSTTGETGDYCEKDSDCLAGFCLKSFEDVDEGRSVYVFDGGYCTAPDCGYDPDTGKQFGCAGDDVEICLMWGGDNDPDLGNHCFVLGCETDWDCREGWTCVDFGFYPFTSFPTCIPPREPEQTSSQLPIEELASFETNLEE